MITREQIIDIYSAAHIRLDESQADELATKFSALIEYNKILMEVDTESVEPTELNTDNLNVFREDVPTEGLDRESALSLAAHREYGYYKLQKVLG